MLKVQIYRYCREQYLKRILFAAFFIALFSSPFVILQDINHGRIDGKYIYFDIVSAGILMLLGLLIIRYKYILTIKFGWTDVILVGYACYLLALSQFQFNGYNSSLLNQITLIYIYILFKVIFQMRDRVIYLQTLIIIFLSSAALQAAYGLFRMLLNFEHAKIISVQGTFHNPGPFGIYLSGPLILATTIILNPTMPFIKVDSKIIKYIAIICVVSILIILPFTDSRTAWISSAVGMTLILINHYWKVIGDLKLSFRGILIGIFCFLVITGYIALWMYKLKPLSASGRLLIWKVSTKMILDKPIFGFGPHGFENNYLDYQSEYFECEVGDKNDILTADEVWFAYNDFIQIWIEHGLLGIVFIIIAITSALLKSHILGRYFLITCLVSSLSSYPLQGLPSSINFYVALVLCTINEKKIYTLKFKKYKIVGIIFLFISIYAIIFSKKNLKFQKDSFIAEIFFYQGKFLNSQKKYQELSFGSDLRSLEYYAKGLTYLGRKPEAILIYERSLKIGWHYYQLINLGKTYHDVGEFAKAEEMFVKASNMIPNRIYPKYLLTKLYVSMSQMSKAKYMARQVLATSEKIPSLATREMKEEVKKYLPLFK